MKVNWKRCICIPYKNWRIYSLFVRNARCCLGDRNETKAASKLCQPPHRYWVFQYLSHSCDTKTEYRRLDRLLCNHLKALLFRPVVSRRLQYRGIVLMNNETKNETLRVIATKNDANKNSNRWIYYLYCSKLYGQNQVLFLRLALALSLFAISCLYLVLSTAHMWFAQSHIELEVINKR